MSPAVPHPVRLGLIGTGLATEKLHWPALSALGRRFEIAAFADTSRQNAERFAAYSAVPLERHVTDYRDLLRRDDVEAVLIALPIPLLLPAARAALEAGKHVACEKPPGGNLDQGREFLALGEQFPEHTILVMENFFYRDDLRLARSLLDQGAIGTLHLMSFRQAFHFVPQPGGFSSTPWRQQPEYRGGAFLDGGVHFLAQMRLLCGDVEHLHAAVQQANATMGGPSHLTLNLRFVNGAIGNYVAVHSAIPVPRETGGMRLYGSEATLVVSMRRLALHRPDGTVEEHVVEGDDGGYYNELLNFYDAVVHGEPLLGTIAQSFHNMLLVFRALDSAEGRRVESLDDAPGGLSAAGVPLWKPRGAKGLFDGLPCVIRRETRPPLSS